MLLKEQLLTPTRLNIPKTSSKLFVWGLGTSGQVGFPSYNISIAQLSAGNSHAIALTSDNRLFAWGLNSSGQLGDGTTINKSFPVQIGLRGGWKTISAGGNFSMAVRGDGSLFAWGLGTSGQLGLNDAISRSSPTQVTSAFLSDVSWNTVDAGALHTLAYDQRGLLFAWGDNSTGQLGDGHANDRSTPTQIFSVVDSSVNSNINIISKIGTRYSTSVVPIAGSVSGWFGGSGFLTVPDNNIFEPAAGNFTIELFFNATSFSGSTTLVHKGFTSVFTPYYITINSSGNLLFYSSSNGTSWDVASALNFGTASTNTWNHVAVSRVGTNIFLFLNGTLGNTINIGTTALLDNTRPVAIGARNDNTELFVGYISNVRFVKGVGVYSGAFTVPTSILTATQSAGPQGSNINAITGSQTSLLLYTTFNASISQTSWTQISAGASFSAAVDYVTGRLFTWGLNTSGQLGLTNINSPNGDTINRSSPVQVGTSSWRLVSAGQGHTAAIRDNSTLWTWGLNTSFQLGLTDTGPAGSSINRSAPVQVTTGSSNGSWKNVSAGNAFTLAIADNNSLFSWGRNQEGQTGFVNSTTLRSTPQQIATGSWALISAGSSFSAATNNNKLLFTWGAGVGGTQADGTTINRSSPVLIGISSTVTQSSPVQIGTNSWSSISGGSTFFAAVRSDKLLFTWGLNSSGQLGDNTSINKSSPVQVGTSSWNAVAAGSGNQIFAIRLDGTLWTWGAVTTTIQTGGNAPTTSWKQITVYANTSLGLRSDNNLYGWGENNFGQLGQGDTVNRSNPTLINHPNTPTKSWKKLSENNNQNNAVLVIDSDDKLYAWGRNINGQLADGTTVDKSTPTAVMTDKNWFMVSGSKGITTDYLLWGWGINTLGEVGDGTTNNRSSPVNVTAESGTVVSFTMVTGTSTSAGHNFALSIANKLYGWGQNNTGQLGNNTTTNRSAPTILVSPFDTFSWSQVSVGNMDGVGTQGGHTLATRSDGTLYAWGLNASGQIGDSTTVNKSSPVLVTLNYTDVPISWAAVAAANSRSLAIDVDGYLWSWGYNAVHGAIGDGTTVNKSKPVLVTGALTWSKIASGYFHTNAITEDGYMYGWGSNNLGNQGNGLTTARSSPVVIQTVATALSSPVQVPSGLSNYTQIRTNTSAHAAITSDGSLYTWGTNAAGQLGTGTTLNRTIPRKLDNNSWTQVSMGINHALAIRNNNMYAWGGNAGYQLGDASVVNKSSPVQVGATYAGQPLSWTQVSAGASHSLAIDSNSKLYGWGLNASGQLGIITDSFSWTTIDSGGAFSLAIRQDNTLWSWGTNTLGVLGLGDTLNRSSPTQIGNLSNYTQISVTKNVTSAAAAITSSGALFMWGNNAAGVLGDNTTINRSTPVQIPGSWNQVSVGTSHTLAIDSTGRLFGWGLSTALNSSTAPFSWTVVSENTSHVVAVRSDGLLFAWGLNSSGQVGDNTTINKSSPIQIGTGSWTTASAGVNHTLAITSDYRLFAWGGNAAYHLGDNTTVNKSSPVQVVNPVVSWIQVDAANSFSMGITSTNSLYVWGLGTSGQLGTLTEILSWNTISAGSSNSLAIRNNGRLYSWGLNTGFQLGDTSSITKSSPVQVAGTLSWSAVSAGVNHTLGITSTGALYGWGTATAGATGNYFPVYSWTMTTGTLDENIIALRSDNTLWVTGTNANGTLGLGDTISRSNFVQVGTSSFIYVGSGQRNVFAITSDYRLFGWGLNTSGQLGDSTTISKSSPVQLGVGSSWIAAAAGGSHSLFLRFDNTLWTSGNNQFGKLGLIDTVDRSSFTQIGSNLYSKITAGSNTSAAIRTDNTLWTWGYNNLGQLGVSGNIDRSSPTQVTTPGTGPWIDVTSSENYMLGITGLGLGTPFSVYAWGGNGDGATGLNTTLGQNQIPVIVKAGAAGASFTQVATNNVGTNANSMALSSDGKVWMWGYGAQGELGNNAATSRSSPVLVSGTVSWIQVPNRYGNRLVHAIATNYTLYHWGISSTFFPTENLTVISNPVQIGNNTIFNSFGSPTYAINSQPGQGSWTSVAAGNSFSFGIKNNLLYGWGQNVYGETGTNLTTYPIYSPTQIGTNSWSVVTASELGNFAGGIRSDNKLFMWGTGKTQLATYTTVSDFSWVQISMNYFNTMGIRNDGSLWIWGDNSFGQLGDLTTINKSSPVQVGTSSWIAVSAGYLQSAAIKIDGTLWTWGRNYSGSLGINSQVNQSSPVQVGTSSWAQVACGLYWMLGIDANGFMYSWGDNGVGQLGITIGWNGGAGDRSNPTAIGSSRWTQISTGPGNGAAIRSDNTLWIWGRNDVGQLGTNSGGAGQGNSSPVQVTGNWRKVSMNGTNDYNAQAVAAIRIDGTLWTWGENTYGQLGIGDVVRRSSPVQVGTGIWLDVSAGGQAVLALDSGSNLYAWGRNDAGQNGLNDSTTWRVSPVLVPGAWRALPKLNMALALSGAIDASNNFYIWGRNDFGQLGNGTTSGNRSSPVQLAGSWTSVIQPSTYAFLAPSLPEVLSSPVQIGNSSWTQLSTGASHSLAIRADGTLWTWGINTSTSVLGLNDTINRSSPTQIGTSSWTSVSAGFDHSMAIRSDNTLWGWGNHILGQIGKITDLFSWSVVASGNEHTVALRSDGLLFAWGNNNAGQLGLRDTINRSSPVQVSSETWSNVYAGGSHTLAIRSNILYAWGWNGSGQLGDSTITNRSSPVLVQGGLTFDPNKISLGYAHTAAITTSNLLYVWGFNFYGALGNSNTVDRSAPTLAFTSLTSVSRYTQVATGTYTTFAIANTNILYASGSNQNGELGDGTTVRRSSPVTLAGAFATTAFTFVKSGGIYVGVGGQGGYDVTTAITTSNTLAAWGRNNFGQVGDGTTVDRSSPVTIAGSWTTVAGGYYNTIGIKSDGTLWTWGLNNSGQLGDSTFTNRSSPVLIGSNSWSQVTNFGLTAGLAAISNNLLYIWGSDNTFGQFGFGDTVLRSSPTLLGNNIDINTRSPVQIPGSWSQVSAGNQFTLARDTNGILYAWGQDTTGQLGF